MFSEVFVHNFFTVESFFGIMKRKMLLKSKLKVHCKYTMDEKTESIHPTKK